VARRRTLVVDLIPIAVLALHDRLCPRLAPLCQIIILILQRVREFVREDGSLFFEGHGVQQENGLGLFVVKPGNRLPVRLHQELTQVEVPRQQAELLHREFGACETLGKIGASQTVLGEFFDACLPHDSFLYRIVLGEPGVFAGELKNFIHGGEQFLGIDVGHFYVGRLVLAHFPRHIGQALRWCGCSRGGSALCRTCCSLLTDRRIRTYQKKRKQAKDARSRGHF